MDSVQSHLIAQNHVVSQWARLVQGLQTKIDYFNSNRIKLMKISKRVIIHRFSFAAFLTELHLSFRMAS